MNEQIKSLRKSLNLTQQGFADRLGVKRNTVAQWEIGVNNLSDQVIRAICREFNVSETWLRTGEGEMFTPSPDGALETLAQEYELSPGMCVLIKRLLALKPENQRAVVDFAVKIAEDLNSMDAPVVSSKTETTAPAQTVPDIAAELAELKRQNQELAAEIAAMKEEDALLGLTDGFSISPAESAGNLSPRAKK